MKGLLAGSIILVALGLAASSPAPVSRNKRSLFGFSLGKMILDINCKDGTYPGDEGVSSRTVCAPGGAADCPVGYSTAPNTGACGFATLAHYLESGEIAGTCCFTSAAVTSAPTTPDATTAAPGVDPVTSAPRKPNVVVYAVPVWKGFGQTPGVQSYGSDMMGAAAGAGGSDPASKSSPIYQIEAVDGDLAFQGDAGDIANRQFPQFGLKELPSGGSYADPNARQTYPQTLDGNPQYYPYPSPPQPV